MPTQEEERHGDQRDDRDRVAVDHRVVVHEPPDQRGDAEREAEAENVEQGGAVPAGGAELAGRGAIRLSSFTVAVVISESRPIALTVSTTHFVTLARKLTSAWICAGLSVWEKFGGMIPAW